MQRDQSRDEKMNLYQYLISMVLTDVEDCKLQCQSIEMKKIAFFNVYVVL